MAVKAAGQSISKVTTDKEQNELRRAAKARQHSNRSTAPKANYSGSGNRTSGFAWSPQEYASTPMFLANCPKQEVEKRDHFPFNATHAGLALRHKAIIKLVPGSGARLLAAQALSQYPLVSRDGGLKHSEVAIQQAVDFLTTEGTTRFSDGVILRATRAVKTALRETYEMAQASLVTV